MTDTLNGMSSIPKEAKKTAKAGTAERAAVRELVKAARARVRRTRRYQAADEAMMAVLTKLPTFEGRSRFTTWAYKFAILQSATEVRRCVWAHREVELGDLTHVPESGVSPANCAEAADLAVAVRLAIDVALTPHQRRITIALLVDEVPIDVLAQRLGSTRNALYKTVHDARTRLRAHLIASGHLTSSIPKAGTP
ncbi:MAG: sigma-70 family RNA polymerase sigma factor [Humibacillus sp.]